MGKRLNIKKGELWEHSRRSLDAPQAFSKRRRQTHVPKALENGFRLWTSKFQFPAGCFLSAPAILFGLKAETTWGQSGEPLLFASKLSDGDLFRRP